MSPHRGYYVTHYTDALWVSWNREKHMRNFLQTLGFISIAGFISIVWFDQVIFYVFLPIPETYEMGKDVLMLSICYTSGTFIYYSILITH